MGTKPRRVRMYLCEHCGVVSPLSRRQPGDEFPVTVCVNCYFVAHKDAVPSWLEYPGELQKVTPQQS